MVFNISVRSNVKELQKSLNAFVEKQIPFAIATACTSTAKLVQAAEIDQLRKTFKNPSPFTLKSIRVIPARKNTLTATVFMMDKTAEYVDPYETGGVHKLSSKALLNPKDIKLNQYGQLPKAALAALKARPDVFIGPVKTAHGMVNGVWQRVTDNKHVTLLNAKGKRLRGLNKATVSADGKSQGHLKLIIRFGDALPVKQHLGYQARAKAIVDANFNNEFKKALNQAMATAK
jgi:hypothetical protein